MFERLLGKIAAALNKHKIPYMVIGGQAVLVYGEPRATKDIDVTLGLGIEGLPRLLDVLKAAKFRCLVPDVEDFAKKTMVVPALDPTSGIRIDFILSFSEYERTAIGRARRIKVGRAFVSFASLEDLVVHKMVAGRPRDIEDIESVLLKNPHYDAAFIRERLKEFDIALDSDLSSRFKMIENGLRAAR
ncbi:MAG: hypothetical protein NTZ26_02745 [Candidatus Aminicenantes bacterium]|nr:hypothetical protein [Candidatus Aminicenantes bacterium]